jgi:hypothetical protein
MWAATKIHKNDSKQQYIPSGALSAATLQDNRELEVNWQTIFQNSKTYTYFIKYE